VRETADREVTSMDTDMDIIESSHRPSGTSSQSRGSDVSKPPPIAAKPRVRNTGQYSINHTTGLNISTNVTFFIFNKDPDKASDKKK